MKFKVIKQETPCARWVNWRVELHVFLGLPSIHTVQYMQLKEEFLMCVSLETTSEVTDDQEEMNNFCQNIYSCNHIGSLCSLQTALSEVGFYSSSEQTGRDGFRERGAQAILIFGAPRRCDLFGYLSEKHESMPLLLVIPIQNIYLLWFRLRFYDCYRSGVCNIFCRWAI